MGLLVDPDNFRLQPQARLLAPMRLSCSGLAWAYKLEPDPRFLWSALKTLDLLDKQFASSSGGFHPPHRRRPQMSGGRISICTILRP